MKICPIAKNAKVGTKVCQILNKPSKKLPKDFKKIAKLAKFGQIWSHYLLLLKCSVHKKTIINLQISIHSCLSNFE